MLVKLAIISAFVFLCFVSFCHVVLHLIMQDVKRRRQMVD